MLSRGFNFKKTDESEDVRLNDNELVGQSIWRPSWMQSRPSGEAYFAKKKEEHAITTFLDGSNAPKLTGNSSWHLP
jgi:hypothetical protein